MITRRTFLIGLAANYPALSRAQPAAPAAKPVRVGIFRFGQPETAPSYKAFVDAMRELGWTEGRNVIYDRVFTEDQARVPALASELVARRPDLVYVNTNGTAHAVLARTRTIPIIGFSMSSPVESGLVQSLARPGGNVTGIANIGWELGGRRMQLLKEILPMIRRVGVLAIRGTGTLDHMKLIEHAAGAGVNVVQALVREGELEPALAILAENRVEALLTYHHSFFLLHRKRILDFAMKHRIPVIGHRGQQTNDGALMSYSSNLLDQARRSAQLADKVLKGTRPADIPVEQPTKFELVVNLKTAKALGITIPQSILLQAERVIE